jgi:hypothetical protein
MKKAFLFAAVAAVAVLAAACSHKKENDEIMRFYLSQPRDPELVGWWQAENDSEGNEQFTAFRADGSMALNITASRGELYPRWCSYWYTKENVLHEFYRFSDTWASPYAPQHRYLYEIRENELWMRRDGDAEWYCFGKRTEPRL